MALLVVQVERLGTCLANEQIARDLVTKQLLTATREKEGLQEKVKFQQKEIARLESELDEVKFCSAISRPDTRHVRLHAKQGRALGGGGATKLVASN
jgi:predicted nucleotide-binding protein